MRRPLDKAEGPLGGNIFKIAITSEPRWMPKRKVSNGASSLIVILEPYIDIPHIGQSCLFRESDPVAL